jgi:hypothetical protein
MFHVKHRGVSQGIPAPSQTIPRHFRRNRRQNRDQPPPPAHARRAIRHKRGTAAPGRNDITRDIGSNSYPSASFCAPFAIHAKIFKVDRCNNANLRCNINAGKQINCST